MTMKTRSSANYSQHLTAATVPIFANRTMASLVGNTLSSSSNKNNMSNTNAAVNVDTIMAAKNEANQKFLRSYQAHLNKQFVTKSRQWLSAANFTQNEIDEIIASFQLNDTNLETKTKPSGGEGCTVLSPVKKKQKSNDYNSAHNRGHNATGKTNTSHKHPKVLLLPPNATQSQSTQHPIIKKYEHIAHGLSVSDLFRIESLKKNELIEAIDDIDGEYHKSWTKPILVDALLRAHAALYQPETTETGSRELVSNANNLQISNHEIDNDVVILDAPMEYTTSEKHDTLHSSNVDTARTMSADDNKKRPSDTIKNGQEQNGIVSVTIDADNKNDCIMDDRMSVASIPALHMEMDDGNDKNVVGDTGMLQQAPSDDSDEEIFISARENLTQSQSQVQQYGKPPSTNTMVLTKQTNHVHNNIDVIKSAFEINASSSSMHGAKQLPQPQPRNSPTTVPLGIVDSAKKLLMSSQKKNQKSFQLAGSHSQPQPLVGRVLLYRDPQCTATQTTSKTTATMMSPANGQPITEPQHTVVKYPSTIFPGDLVFSNTTTTGTTTNNSYSVNRILSTPAYSSNGSTSGMSLKLQASKEARQAHVARMKEKSKQTLPQKAIHLTSENSIRQHQLQQNFVDLSTTTPSVTTVSQKYQLQSAAAKPALVDTIKSKPHHHQTAVTYTKPKSPVPVKQPEFTSYEMTDGEYDSDDDDDDISTGNQKMVPDWARSKNLEKALEIQFSKNYPIDPDTLFGEVETCNLEAIFGKKSSKYRHRNSSGDWTKDRVTSAEKRWYKQQVA